MSTPEPTGIYSDYLYLPKAAFPNIAALKRSLTLTSASGDLVHNYLETPDHLGVPRAMYPESSWSDELGIPVKVHTSNGAYEVEVSALSRLRDDQVPALEALLSGSGVLVLPPGFGKTVIVMHAFAQLRRPMLVIVHTVDLALQWRERIVGHTSLEMRDVGIVGDGQVEWERPVTIAMVQTLSSMVRNGTLPKNFREHFGIAVFDEAHHLGASTFLPTATITSGVRWFVTATPKRQDGMEIAYFAHAGPILYESTAHERRHPVKTIFVYTGRTWSVDDQEACQSGGKGQKTFNKKLYEGHVMKSTRRVRLAKFLIDSSIAENRPMLVVSGCRETLISLHAAYEGRAGLLIGGVKEDRAAILANNHLIFSTVALCTEGLDKPELTDGLLLEPLPDSNAQQQLTGRFERPCPGKPEGRLFVLEDQHCPKAREWCTIMRTNLTRLRKPFEVVPDV